MDNECQVRFVEAHPQRRGGHNNLHVVVEELLLYRLSLLAVAVAGVGDR